MDQNFWALIYVLSAEDRGGSVPNTHTVTHNLLYVTSSGDLTLSSDFHGHQAYTFICIHRENNIHNLCKSYERKDPPPPLPPLLRPYMQEQGKFLFSVLEDSEGLFTLIHAHDCWKIETSMWFVTFKPPGSVLHDEKTVCPLLSSSVEHICIENMLSMRLLGEGASNQMEFCSSMLKLQVAS